MVVWMIGLEPSGIPADFLLASVYPFMYYIPGEDGQFKEEEIVCPQGMSWLAQFETFFQENLGVMKFKRSVT